jgi:hypothetical protein
MTARKSARGKRKTAARKPAAGGRPAAKKTARKRAAPAAAVKDAPEAVAAPAVAERNAARKGGVSAADVNLGHVFALRPAVPKAFRQEDFRAARHLLEDETYASLEEAARAVAEKALELTREAGSKTVRPVR